MKKIYLFLISVSKTFQQMLVIADTEILYKKWRRRLVDIIVVFGHAAGDSFDQHLFVSSFFIYLFVNLQSATFS